MNDVPSRMPWLQAAPPDFRAQLKAASNGDLKVLQSLACRELDVNQLAKLSGAIGRCRETLSRLDELAKLRLGVVSSHTADFILDALPATALRHSLLMTCVRSGFGQLGQVLLDENSPLLGQVDAVLLALDAKAIGLDRARLADGAGDIAVANAIDTMKGYCDAVRLRLKAFCVVTSLPPPAEALFGELERRVGGATRSMIEAYNARLVAEVLQPGDVFVDLAQVANSVGLIHWHDARAWHAYKLPFALEFTPLYCDHVCRVLAAVRGKARKCLVLDLDNTLWGGVIGDDGLEKIELGQGTAAGEAHAALQAYALQLRDRGVLLAVCSKNDEANAVEPFKAHPEMILKLDHIAAFVANWNDKASNLREIAARLNIGTDALVFLDDNPVEREIVRRELPEVAVPEPGNEPSDYVAALGRGGWFEALSFSTEDRNRATFYQANAARSEAQSQVTDFQGYLRSLEMTAIIEPFHRANRSRIAQLINKSNQFNLTTRRYTEADVANFESAGDKFTATVRLIDRFLDNGLISVAIFDKRPDVWTCDTWLMSCRVLGRRVEEALLAFVAAAAAAAGASRLRGLYIPTKKNGLVARHFASLGFHEIGAAENGGALWEMDLKDYAPPELPLMVNPIAGIDPPFHSLPES